MQDIDHAIAGAIVLVSVAQAFVDPDALKQAPRLAFFKAGATTGLIMVAVVLLAWHASDRLIAEFGLYGWIGSAPVVTAVFAFTWPLFLFAAGTLMRGRFRVAAQCYYSGYSHLMPRSRRQIPAAYGAGTFAAFGEEIAYRGFLIWYLQSFTGLPLAVLASSIIFGIAHGYQGKVGMVFGTIAGLLLAAAYVLSGSLLLIIWMHASYNVASFMLGYSLLQAAKASGFDPADAPLQS